MNQHILLFELSMMIGLFRALTIDMSAFIQPLGNYTNSLKGIGYET